MPSDNRFRRDRDRSKPQIWVSGGQRPPFDLRVTGRAALYLSRLGVASLHAGAARMVRQAAVNVRDGTGRVRPDALGGAARYLPSHLRVAAWIKTLAAVASHASATADPDVKRGNALVAEIEPHLWDPAAPPPPPPPEPVPAPQSAPEVAPVVLQEPAGYDPLASIREKLAHESPASPDAPDTPDQPPAPPGAVAVAAIQVSGYLLGWASAILALPYGLARALWLHARGVDLKTLEDRED